MSHTPAHTHVTAQVPGDEGRAGFRLPGPAADHAGHPHHEQVRQGLGHLVGAVRGALQRPEGSAGARGAHQELPPDLRANVDLRSPGDANAEEQRHAGEVHLHAEGPGGGAAGGESHPGFVAARLGAWGLRYVGEAV